MGRPAGEIAADSGGRGHLRVSHADREQVIDALKVAFVQGRLTKDELDARAGQTFVARTFAELAVVTADIPAGPDLARPPVPARAQPDRPESGAEKWVARSGAGATLALMVAASAWAVAVGRPELIAMLVVVIGAVAATAAGFVAIVLSVVWALTPESRQRKSSDGQLPPRSASGPGGQASRQPAAADPAGRFPPVDHGQQHWLLTRERRIPDGRKHGNAGARPLTWTVGEITC